MITHEYSLDHFPEQVNFALTNYINHGLSHDNFDQVIIGGLGGSGIGGRIAKAYFYDKACLPIEVFSDYSLPAYTSKKSLVILCSYSGTTEETLAMYNQAKSIGSTIICITSGGDLLEIASKDNINLYKIETGYQPRMALGFSLTYNLLILGELFQINVAEQLKEVISLYQDSEKYKAKAKEILNQFENNLNNKFVIVSDNPTEAISIRFCQQIQENAKTEAFVNVLPEANHNVFETYYGELPSNFIFINSNNNDRNNGRFAYLKQLLEKNNNKVVSLDLNKSTLLELYKTIYICDWFSIYLSNAKGKDNMSVPNIVNLKNFLKTF